MNAPSSCRLLVDPALYTSVAGVMKSLSEHFHCVKSVTGLIQAKKGNRFYKTQNEIYMGILLSQVTIAQSNTLRLTVQELSPVGQTGSKYFIFLYNALCDEFLKGNFLKALKKNEKVLIVFQNVPYKYKSGMDCEVEFHITSLEKFNTLFVIKHFFMSPSEATDIEDYTYISLTHAAETLAQSCNFYGVVDKILKEPSLTSRKSVHGMLLLVDSTCYEGGTRKLDYPLHVFASSVEGYPQVSRGDIIRVHRVRTEARDNGNKPDFRIFRERDIVVFPSDSRQAPRSATGRYTFTESDFELVNQLRQWAKERFHQAAPVNEAHLTTLSQIPVDRTFNLVCRLVEFFVRANAVALWVEDGTLCSLNTISDGHIAPYDSQATQDICNNNRRICVHASMEAVGALRLQVGAVLYLRDVDATVFQYPDTTIEIFQFEVKGTVEALPHCTRYYNTLMRRLDKEKTPAVQPPSAKEPECSDWRITEVCSLAAEEPSQQPPPVPGNAAPTSVEEAAAECSTDQAMAEMSSDVFKSQDAPPNQLGCQNLDQEENRLLMMINPAAASQDLETYPSHPLCTESQTELRRGATELSETAAASPPPNPFLQLMPSQLDLSFSQIVTSTQKPSESMTNRDISEGQSLFPDTAVEADGSSSSQGSQLSRTSRSRQTCVVRPSSQVSADLFDSNETRVSPCPVYRAVNEVLDIITQTSPVTQNVELAEKGKTTQTLQANADEDDDEDLFSASELPHAEVKSRKVHWKDLTADGGGEVPTTSRKRKTSDSSCQELSPRVQREASEEDSDDSSIIVYNPLSQPDLEVFFDAVDSVSEPTLSCLASVADASLLDVDARFRVRGRVSNLLPRTPSEEGGPLRLEDLLVAYCCECRHIWQYHHFKESKSVAVRRKRRLRTDSSADEESVQLAGRRVFNYLCSEEEYRQNLQRWSSAEGQDGGYQMDELLHLDYSFAFVCPMCKSDGVPDVLCQLEPSFFFWIHIEQEGGGCLCLLAAGVHAEYFLGTKADHVCRSEEVRQCARDRLDRLIASVDESNLVLNLGVRKVSSSAGDQTGEFHLEDTFLVYDSRHILPW